VAQATRLASFGPFFVFVGLHWPLLACVSHRWLLWAFVVNKTEKKPKKKPYLGPKRRAWRRLGLFSSSWACIGLRWPAVACVGRRWLLWAFVVNKTEKEKKKLTWGPSDAPGVVWALFRLRGPALAFIGLCWPVLACVGRRWLLWACVVNKTEKKPKKNLT